MPSLVLSYQLENILWITAVFFPKHSHLIFPEYLSQTLQGSQEPEAGRRKEVSDSFYHTLG